MAERPIYVIDTNILVDYVDIIPGNGAAELIKALMEKIWMIK